MPLNLRRVSCVFCLDSCPYLLPGRSGAARLMATAGAGRRQYSVLWTYVIPCARACHTRLLLVPLHPLPCDLFLHLFSPSPLHLPVCVHTVCGCPHRCASSSSRLGCSTLQAGRTRSALRMTSALPAAEHRGRRLRQQATLSSIHSYLAVWRALSCTPSIRRVRCGFRLSVFTCPSALRVRPWGGRAADGVSSAKLLSGGRHERACYRGLA
jgi:hypothetical protein